MATRQLVVFSINNEEFGVDVSQVNIIERHMEIFKIPNTPEFVEGLVNLRGKVYTVFSMRKRFGLPAKDLDDNTKIIMVNTGVAVVGLIVDKVDEIIKVEDKDIENTPNVLGDVKRKFINNVAKVNDRIILLLNLETILAVDETIAVTK